MQPLAQKYLYIKSTTVYVPSSEIETPQTPLLQASCPPPPPRPKGEGHTRLRLRGWGSPNSDDWVRSFSRKSRPFSGKSRVFLKKALLFFRLSSCSRLKKKKGFFQKSPTFSKVVRLFNHTGYTQYVLKKPGMFQYNTSMEISSCLSKSETANFATIG